MYRVHSVSPNLTPSCAVNVTSPFCRQGTEAQRGGPTDANLPDLRPATVPWASRRVSARPAPLRYSSAWTWFPWVGGGALDGAGILPV